MKTAFFQDNLRIISARLSIDYYAPDPQKPTPRREAFSQDICEWAGFVDILQKGGKYSIFGPDDSLPNHPTNADLNYFAVIKYNREFGHGSSGSIPDYDPVSSSGGVYVVNSLGVNPAKRNSYKSTWLRNPSDLSNEFKESMEYERRYKLWEQKQEMDKLKKRKDLEKDIR